MMTTEQGKYLIKSNLDLTQSAMQMTAYIDQLEAEVAALRKANAELSGRYAKLCRSYKARAKDYKALYERHLASQHDQTILGEMIDKAIPSIFGGVRIGCVFGIAFTVAYIVSNWL